MLAYYLRVRPVQFTFHHCAAIPRLMTDYIGESRRGERTLVIRDAAAGAGAKTTFLRSRGTTSLAPVFPLLVSSTMPFLGTSNL